MTKRNIAIISSYYLFLPLAIFLCSWVKVGIGIPLTIILCVLPLFLFKNIKGNSVSGTITQETIILVIVFGWVLLSGIGGYVWQNRWDHIFRNVVFEDLSYQTWPVQNGNSVLTYYIGFWLPSALISKVTNNIEIGYFA